MLLSTGTILSTGIASLPIRMSLKESSRSSWFPNGDQLRSSPRNSPTRLLPTSDLDGLGSPRIKMILPSSTPRMPEIPSPAITSHFWLSISGSTPTTLTTEMPEQHISKISLDLSIGNSSTKTLNLTRLTSNSDSSCSHLCWLMFYLV